MGDLDWIRSAINTPAMMTYLGGEVRSEDAVRESLEADVAAFDTAEGHQRWTVWRGDERVGRIGLFHVRTKAAPEALHGQREIGWMFAQEHQGQGYATEAARAVLDWAFARGIATVFAQTSDSNAASTRMMQRLGLTRRAELDYVDPEYPEVDNPTTVWSTSADVACETERLVLRDWRAEDWPRFFAVTNTPEVMRWLGGVMDADSQAAQMARVSGCRAANGFCFWVVERKADGELLGFCGLKRADAPGSSVAGEFEIGWRLREDAWGRGYAREAASAALALAFGRFDAERVFALTVEGNAASWGLMHRLGMERRPELDYHDPRLGPDLNPTIVYGITAQQWSQHEH